MSTWLLLALACSGVGDKTDDTEDSDPGTDTEATGDTEDTGMTALDGRFSRTGGCSDTFVYGVSDDDTWALAFSDTSGMVETAHETGEVQEQTYDLSLDYALSPTVWVEQGENLSTQYCNDAIEPYTVDEQWYGVRGNLTIRVEATGEATEYDKPAEATLTLEDVVFEAWDAEPVRIDSFMTTVNVGWLPG